MVTSLSDEIIVETDYILDMTLIKAVKLFLLTSISLS